MKSKIGITGATGFVGRHLVNRLLDEGYQVSALVLEKKADLPKKVKTFQGNLATGSGIKEFLKNIDILVHLAARVEFPEEKMFDDNVRATYNLISASPRFPIKQIIYMSTAAVYGNDRGKKLKETDICFPNTEYGITKYLSEKIVEHWSTVTGKPSTIFRPFNMYGPGNFKGIMYNFYKSVKETGKIVVYGKGTQARDFMYIEDAIGAVVLAIKKRMGGVFNIGVGRTYTVLELLDVFQKVMGNKIKISFSPAETGKVFNIRQDMALVMKKLGWKAKVPLEEGLKKTIEWYDQKF